MAGARGWEGRHPLGGSARGRREKAHLDPGARSHLPGTEEAQGGSLDTKPLEAKGTVAESSRRRQGVGGASPPGAGAAAHGGGKGERLDPGAGVVW